MDKTQRIHAQADTDKNVHDGTKDRKTETAKVNKETHKKRKYNV